MKEKLYCLGIDTSNYTTSAAVVDEKLKVISDSRELLKVKNGDRGLRQSQALFEHISNLPKIIKNLNVNDKKGKIVAVAFSDKPRQIEGSYMPVFKAGETVGRCVAELLGVEYFCFSHQEGHIQAAKKSSGFEENGEFLSLHLSGGTTEVLKCRDNPDTGGYYTEIVGGSKDISFGQLIDRIGVSLGFGFPCGKIMDEYACRAVQIADGHKFCKIKTEDGMMNISGIETQIQRHIESIKQKDEMTERVIEEICGELFFRIAQTIKNVIEQAKRKTGIQPIIIAGGVASSKYIRKYMESEEKIYFGKPELSSDNGVGTAMLGMKKYLGG